MTTTPKPRPTTARKVTRKTEEKRTSEHETGIRIVIDGEAHEVRLGDLTPSIALELRQQVGFSFLHLCQLINVDSDIDLVAAVVWLSARVKGEAVRFADVSVTYDQMLADDFELGETDVESVDGDAGPEA